MRMLVLLFAVFLSAPLSAHDGHATDAAYAALLSMPGAGPGEDGFWDFPVPKDFTVKTEAGLIAYIARQQKAGADVNAYRHFGTLLHHAIRAGKTKTALWLLDHGADPRKTLKGGTDDAFSLSVTHERFDVVAVLQKKFGIQPDYKRVVVPPEPDWKALLKKIETLSPTYATEADFIMARKLLEMIATSEQFQARPAAPGPAARERMRQWSVLRKKMPPGVYAKVLDVPRVPGYFLQIFMRSPEALNGELDALPAGFISRSALFDEFVQVAVVQSSSAADPKTVYWTPVESWRVLWRHRVGALDYALSPDAAQRVQPALWPELFASGYANHHAVSALGCMLSDMNAGELTALWPQMLASFPDIRQSAPAMVLRNYRATSEAACTDREPDETRKKLLWLTSQGIKATVGDVLKSALADVPVDLMAAMKPFISINPAREASAPARLVRVAAQCRFDLTDVWYKELKNKPVVTRGEPSEHTAIDTVQLIEIPGEQECGLLVGGSERVNDTYISGDEDSFYGPEPNPTPSCPDPTDRYQILQHKQGKIVRLETDMGGDDGAPELIAVKDVRSGTRYYLHTGEQYGRCHGVERPPFTFKWQQTKDAWALMNNQVAPELANALFDQCSSDGDKQVCKGIDGLGEYAGRPDGVKPTVKDAFAPIGLSAFIGIFRAPEVHDVADFKDLAPFRQYLAAVLALDKPLLKTLQAQGIPGTWTAEAIRQVGASSLPLMDKRKRTAWLFIDRAQLLRTLNAQLVEGLLDWLPREDWGPILQVASAQYAGRDIYDFNHLRQKAEEAGLSELACDFDHARGLMCGETWGTQR